MSSTVMLKVLLKNYNHEAILEYYSNVFSELKSRESNEKTDMMRERIAQRFRTLIEFTE